MVTEDSVSKDRSHSLSCQFHVSSLKFHCLGEPVNNHKNRIVALRFWYGPNDIDSDCIPRSRRWLEGVKGGRCGCPMGFCPLTSFTSFNVSSDISLELRPPVVA